MNPQDLQGLEDELIARYVSGTCVPSDLEVLDRWVGGDPDRRSALNDLRQMWEQSARGTSEEQVGVLWGKLAGSLALEPSSEPVSPSLALSGSPRRQVFRLSTIRSPWVAPWILAAACIVIVAAIGVWVRQAAGPGIVGSTHEYSTSVGQHLSVRLADGTQVTLAPESHVWLPADYERGNRAVRLDGEAYFAVVHNAAHPFAVRAGDVVVRDIGTSYDVRSYPEDSSVRVVVAEGMVGLSTPMACVECQRLGKGDEALVTSSGATVRHEANVSALVSWLQQGIAFDDTPMRKVAITLERTYGLQVAIPDSTLASDRVTVVFGDEPEDVVLDAIGRIIGARVQRVGRHVAFVRGRASVETVPRKSPAPPLTTAMRDRLAE